MDKYVHKSEVQTLKRCSMQFYYKNVLEIKPEFINETSIAGSAFHSFTQQVYKEKEKWNDLKYWIEFFVKNFNERKEKIIKDDIEIKESDIKSEQYAEMIIEFLRQEYNREAECILSEIPFRFVIKRRQKEYWFEGIIDQLLKIKYSLIEHLIKPWENLPKPTKEYVYIHRDYKTGNRNQMTEINVTTDDNINFYAYGLAFGLFDIKLDGNFNHRVKLIPFAHALHYTRDYFKYKKNTGDNKIGDYRGKALYFVKKDLKDLKRMEDELINLHKKRNSNIYTRDGAANHICNTYCGFKSTCLYHWNNG